MTDGVGNRGAKNITIPVEIHKKAKGAAIDLGVSLQQLIADAVIEKLGKSSTKSQAELQGKSPGAKAVSGFAVLPSGHRISKPLAELIPQLESILEDREATKLLKRLIHSLYHQGGAGVEVEQQPANSSPSSQTGRRPHKGDRDGA
jgi:hypothetical protein